MPIRALAALLGILGCTEASLVPRTTEPGLTPPGAPDRLGPFALAAPPPAARWGLPPPEPPAPGDPLFEEGTIHRFELELSSDARSRLSADPGADVPATFTYEGRSWLVGLHLKGSRSYRPLSAKAAFKIDFGELVDGQRFLGLRRLTLNNMVQDRSMIREHVAYRAYAWLGVPAPRHGYAEVWVNGEPFGLYGIVETPDGTWAERLFWPDDDGPIYEGGYGVDLEDGDAYDFALQRQGDLAEPWTDVEALVEALEATPPEDILAFLEDNFDAPALFRMWAMDLASGHRDGYVNRKNNFLLYHGLDEDRWWMIPWGQDQAMRDGMGVHGHYAGALADACAEAPDCQARIDAALGYVVDLWEAWDLHRYAAATGAAIEAACERDPRREAACGYGSVLEMIAERPAEVRAMLEENR